MNKQKLQQTIEETKAKLAELQKKLNEPEHNKAMTVPSRDLEKHRRIAFFVLGSGSHGFLTDEHRDAFSDAIQVMLEIRAQPGQVVASGEEQWIIEHPLDGDIRVVNCSFICSKLDCCIFGIFSSESSARKAIETVGEDRIIKAAKALVGVY